MSGDEELRTIALMAATLKAGATGNAYNAANSATDAVQLFDATRKAIDERNERTAKKDWTPLR